MVCAKTGLAGRRAGSIGGAVNIEGRGWREPIRRRALIVVGSMLDGPILTMSRIRAAARVRGATQWRSDYARTHRSMRCRVPAASRSNRSSVEVAS